MNEMIHDRASWRLRAAPRVIPGTRSAEESRKGNRQDEPFLYDEIDRRLMDTFPASDAVARY